MKPLILVSILSLCLGVAMINVIGKQASAKAYATTRLADQRAADMRQAREHREIVFELEQAKREAIAPHVVSMKTALIYIVGSTVAILSIVVTSAIGYLGFGVARAGVAAAQTRARLIPMDKATMHFPALIIDNGRRQYSVDINTGLVLPADTARGPYKVLAENSGATRQLGIQPRDMVVLNRREDSVSELTAS